MFGIKMGLFVCLFVFLEKEQTNPSKNRVRPIKFCELMIQYLNQNEICEHDSRGSSDYLKLNTQHLELISDINRNTIFARCNFKHIFELLKTGI